MIRNNAPDPYIEVKKEREKKALKKKNKATGGYQGNNGPTRDTPVRTNTRSESRVLPEEKKDEKEKKEKKEKKERKKDKENKAKKEKAKPDTKVKGEKGESTAEKPKAKKENAQIRQENVSMKTEQMEMKMERAEVKTGPQDVDERVQRKQMKKRGRPEDGPAPKKQKRNRRGQA